MYDIVIPKHSRPKLGWWYAAIVILAMIACALVAYARDMDKRIVILKRVAVIEGVNVWEKVEVDR